MSKATDISVKGVSLFFLPIQNRVPLKFGVETVTSVTCARVRVRVEDSKGRSAEGWGETPLSVQWVWPSSQPYEPRLQALQDFCVLLTGEWSRFGARGHPMEVGYRFLQERLPKMLAEFNAERGLSMPWLAALVCGSAFDLAIHDAFGNLHGIPAYQAYGRDWMSSDLGEFLKPAPDARFSFRGLFPADFLVSPPQRLQAWHLVGGKDRLTEAELDGSEPRDGYPVILADWIRRDGLRCLKVKLTGSDMEWDYDRLVRVGKIGLAQDVLWLTADFNCTVTDPGYVNAILDRLLWEHPRTYAMLLYVEQPFPYELEQNQIDVRSVSARKPLFMDESAHDWRMVQLGRSLGWTGVALKTCKTQTGALLSACWAKAHGMTLMVQDLTNPMLAQIPHLLLAAHVGTILGVETNSMQFYPEASAPEAAVHPGVYTRREGAVDLSSIQGPGFGYRLPEINRRLPKPEAECGT